MAALVGSADEWRQWLESQPGTTDGATNDLEAQFLLSHGYAVENASQLNDMWHQLLVDVMGLETDYNSLFDAWHSQGRPLPTPPAMDDIDRYIHEIFGR